jgi:hypothetical protein
MLIESLQDVDVQHLFSQCFGNSENYPIQEDILDHYLQEGFSRGPLITLSQNMQASTPSIYVSQTHQQPHVQQPHLTVTGTNNYSPVKHFVIRENKQIHQTEDNDALKREPIILKQSQLQQQYNKNYNYNRKSPVEQHLAYLAKQLEQLEDKNKILEQQNVQQQQLIQYILKTLQDRNPCLPNRVDNHFQHYNNCTVTSSSSDSIQFVNHEGDEINSWIEKYQASKYKPKRKYTTRKN